MKRLLFGVMALMMLTIACKKSDNSGQSSISDKDTFIVTGWAYKDCGVPLANMQISAVDEAGMATFGTSTTDATGKFAITCHGLPSAKDMSFIEGTLIAGVQPKLICRLYSISQVANKVYDYHRLYERAVEYSVCKISSPKPTLLGDSILIGRDTSLVFSFVIGPTMTDMVVISPYAYQLTSAYTDTPYAKRYAYWARSRKEFDSVWKLNAGLSVPVSQYHLITMQSKVCENADTTFLTLP